jgi:hypothetical protein
MVAGRTAASCLLTLFAQEALIAPDWSAPNSLPPAGPAVPVPVAFTDDADNPDAAAEDARSLPRLAEYTPPAPAPTHLERLLQDIADLTIELTQALADSKLTGWLVVAAACGAMYTAIHRQHRRRAAPLLRLPHMTGAEPSLHDLLFAGMIEDG